MTRKDEARRPGADAMSSQLLRHKFLCEMHPRDAAVFRRFGESLAAFGRHEDAAAAFRRALALKPDDPATLNQLGMAHVRLGQHRRAVEIFKDLLRIAPKYAVAHFNYGLCLLGMNLVEEAVGMLEAAVSLSPTSEAMRIELAAAYRRAGRPEKALAEYSAARELNPRNFTILERMAEIHEELGDLDEAMNLCSSAAELGRNHPSRDALLDNLKRLSRIRRQNSGRRAAETPPEGTGNFLDFLNGPLEAEEPAGADDLMSRLGESIRRDADDYAVLEEMAAALEERGDLARALEVTRRLVILLKNKLESVHDVLTHPDLTA